MRSAPSSVQVMPPITTARAKRLVSREMTDQKLHVAVLFGGRSGEHEVSLMSARSVLSVLDPAKYEVTQVGITHEGTWLTGIDVLNKFEHNKTDGLIPVLVSPD